MFSVEQISRFKKKPRTIILIRSIEYLNQVFRIYDKYVCLSVFLLFVYRMLYIVIVNYCRQY